MNTGRKLLVAAALIASGAFAQVASAQDPILLACEDCTNYAQLQAEANQFATTAPYPANNTTLLLISSTHNVSAYFRVSSYMVCYYYTPYGYPYAYYCTSGGTLVRTTVPVTLTPAEAAALDGQLVAKVVGRVRINPDYGSSAHSALEEDVNSGIRQVVPQRLTFFGTVEIMVNGKWIKAVYDVTEIEVLFADGTKMKFVLKSVMGTIAWVLVSRTDAAGNTINANGGGGGAAPPQPPTTYYVPPVMYCPFNITAHVCIEPVGSNGSCPHGNSGEVTTYLRPCGS